MKKETRLSGTQGILDLLQRNIPWVILIVLCIFFSSLSENFFSFRNIISILNQNAYVIVAALGISLIMMSGGVDLSCGYQMSIISVITGILLTETPLPIPVVVVISMLLGIAMNILNTMLSVKLGLGLFMVSLATMNIFQGISYTISEARIINGLPESFKFLGSGSIGPIPFPIILAAVLFLIMNFFLNRTYWGRYIYALGGNTEASRLAGINVLGVRLMISTIAGVFVALSTMMLLGRLGTAQSTAGPGTEFTIMTGVLVGGVSLRGGEGRLHNVLAGILIMAIFGNGMQMAGYGVYPQFIAKGVIMIAAIAFDVFQYNRRQRMLNTRKNEAAHVL